MNDLIVILILFQSTLPRRERQEIISFIIKILAISIHAPAKGATKDKDDNYLANYISIHAPAKGATMLFMLEVRSYDISIHAPAKGATNQEIIYDNKVQISIHAPAKGATKDDRRLLQEREDFNPRSREGSD